MFDQPDHRRRRHQAPLLPQGCKAHIAHFLSLASYHWLRPNHPAHPPASFGFCPLHSSPRRPGVSNCCTLFQPCTKICTLRSFFRSFSVPFPHQCIAQNFAVVWLCRPVDNFQHVPNVERQIVVSASVEAIQRGPQGVQVMRAADGLARQSVSCFRRVPRQAWHGR